MTVVVVGAMDQLRHTPTEGPATAWLLDTGRCSFELSIDCEPKVATETHSA